MAKKSKTQRAKASAKRAEKREQQTIEETAPEAAAAQAAPAEEAKSKNPFKRAAKPSDTDTAKTPAKQEKPVAKKADKKDAKPSKTSFFKEVRAELKRVTWPTRQDVIRWSGVVVVALLFFSVYVFVLDNWVVTPLLLAISTLGA